MSGDQHTVAGSLAWATDQLRTSSTTPRLDAELLLAHVLGWGRARVLAEGQQPLDASQQAAFRALVARRVNLEPVAYITGHKEFYGLDFVVTPAVLVPRPETEVLVEHVLRVAQQLRDRSPLLIADVGTGSGCIAVAVAVQLAQALVYAIDVSPEALAVARQNSVRHGVGERIRLLKGDLLTPLDLPVDIIVSNPPYTVLQEIDEHVRRHEPWLALDGGRDGLAVYRRLLAQAPAKVRPGGALLLEIGALQGAAVTALARGHFPTARVRVYQDLAGLDRVVVVEPRSEHQAPPG